MWDVSKTNCTPHVRVWDAGMMPKRCVLDETSLVMRIDCLLGLTMQVDDAHALGACVVG